jgi:hypothetical protein
MNDEVLASVLHAVGVAAFERRDDGSFTAVAPPPPWFAGLASDGTFPFLGHVLEEAVAFWDARTTGAREWGPCAEVDANGREFHFMVTALADGRTRYLLFRLDSGSDRMQAVLQQVRERALDAEARARRRSEAAREVSGAIHDLIARLFDTRPTPEQAALLGAVGAPVEALARLAGQPEGSK